MDNGFRFQHGAFLMTRGINDLVAEDEGFAKHALSSLRRHFACDWGDVCAEDRAANDQALLHGDRLFSVYKHADHEDWKIWIITEADRSTTTILFPSKY